MAETLGKCFWKYCHKEFTYGDLRRYGISANCRAQTQSSMLDTLSQLSSKSRTCLMIGLFFRTKKRNLPDCIFVRLLCLNHRAIGESYRKKVCICIFSFAGSLATNRPEQEVKFIKFRRDEFRWRHAIGRFSCSSSYSTVMQYSI